LPVKGKKQQETAESFIMMSLIKCCADDQIQEMEVTASQT